MDNNIQDVFPDTPEQEEILQEDIQIDLQEEDPNDSIRNEFEELRKRQIQLEEQNKKLYARAKKSEEKLKSIDPMESHNEETTINEDERWQKIDLRLEGYDPDETDFIIRNGGKEALDNKFVQAAISQMRAQKRSKQATPSGGNRSPIERKYSQDQLMSMPTEELEKLLRSQT